MSRERGTHKGLCDIKPANVLCPLALCWVFVHLLGCRVARSQSRKEGYGPWILSPCPTPPASPSPDPVLGPDSRRCSLQVPTGW